MANIQKHLKSDAPPVITKEHVCTDIYDLNEKKETDFELTIRLIGKELTFSLENYRLLFAGSVRSDGFAALPGPNDIFNSSFLLENEKIFTILRTCKFNLNVLTIADQNTPERLAVLETTIPIVEGIVGTIKLGLSELPKDKSRQKEEYLRQKLLVNERLYEMLSERKSSSSSPFQG
eukprot:CAMPEP_0201487168 /NCGR_PEP_ID=MMETSP0151_2-20130828/11157_1 /ASSEMBLY_ACC=CAM_ASM_000257 /TAXON_ID=200890 /ORGANISM="Paramoeba atlantica, Strain 621/1 / CCAP 1560/9" /LENGTH=176 /DNA_ID=CAMNT_0047872151 /DNA_START=85 /DNA_END=615 /DNA_ORIENTATION=-